MDAMDVDEEEAEIGIIECVHMKNFMCYSNYKIEFGPKVNIVLGRNGSGKSSILSAIQVGLGGKASSCGKAVVLKNTVQRGKPFAEVSITLRNRGSDAFQPDKYGPSITVERKITSEGVSSYKLKNSRGHVISTKKEDLSAILSAFNIQVNNPVAILTQEMSKSFLNTRDPKEKYNLFFKATQLEQLQKFYKNCVVHSEDVRVILKSKEASLCSLKEKIEGLEKELDNYNSVEEHRKQLGKLYEEFAWSVVYEKEQLVEKLAELKQERMSAAEKAKKKLEGIQERHAEVDKQICQRDQQIKNLNQEIETLSLLKEEQCRQAKEIQKHIREKQNHLDVAAKGKNIAARQKEIENLESQIAKMRMQAEENSRKEKHEIALKIMECKNRIQELEQQRNVLVQKLNSTKADIDKKNEEGSAKKEQYQAVNASCNETERQIEKLKKRKANNLFAYGKNIPFLLKRIQAAVKNGVFHREPFGPLGLYIKVRDSKWALAVECCLGRLLKSFLCDNVEDQLKLIEIMEEVFPNQASPQIITSKFFDSMYDVSERRVYSRDYPCVLDVIQVEEPAIYNCLIDERGIENILLISVAAVARDIMMKNPPPKCNEVYTSKGNSVHPYPTYAFYSSKKKKATLVGSPSDLNESIRLKYAECDALRSSSKLLENEMNAICSHLHLLDNQVKGFETQISKFDSLINKQQVEIQVLEDAEVPDAVCAVEFELVKLQNSLQSALRERTTAVEELSNDKEWLQNLNSQIKATEVQINAKRTELDKLVKQQGQSSMHIERFARQKATFEKHYDEMLKKSKEVEDAYQQQLVIRDDKIAVAEGICPRVHTTRKPQVIDASIDQMKAIIREADESFPNIHSTAASHGTYCDEYKKTSGEIRCLKKTIEKLQSMMQERLKAFEHIQIHISFRVSFLFTASIYPLGYCGNLKFNHENHTLDINVKVGKNIKAPTRSLSGGEKSYITIAMLLALWDAVELPFRIMDEYDVYMDQINRKRSMDLMIDTASSRGGNQFIFFTPQLLTKMKSSSDTNILRLPDPDRRAQLKRKCRDPHP